MGKYRVKINNKVYEVEVEKVDGDFVSETVEAPVNTSTSTSGTASAFNSPIQGTVLKVLVSNNQTVSKGDPLVIIEAMKLENEIFSDRDGVIESIEVKEGTTVNSGQVLVNFRG